MALTPQSFKQRGRRLVCQSGDTRFFLVPANRPAQLAGIEVDTSNQSGLIGNIEVQIRDSYLASGAATSTTIVRKSFSVLGGNVESMVVDGEVQLIGGVDVRTSFSGPIVTVSAGFR